MLQSGHLLCGRFKKRRSSSEPENLIVIGVVELLASGTGWGNNSAKFYSTRSVMSEIAGQDIPFDTFYFSLRDKTIAAEYSQKLEKTFLANAMNSEGLLVSLEEHPGLSQKSKVLWGLERSGRLLGFIST